MQAATASRPILGDHPAMEEVRATIARVAPTNATVLVSGETGTGKELVATAIHEQSARAGGPFVKLSCATLAESVLESELFGHERGSFTGAMARREGRFMQANGGTLYLDEVSEIPLGTQVKLLRVLQEREFERVGGNETISVDVRLVAATNRDLLEAIGARKFREDLFYRLNVVHIEGRPLRTRPSDVQTLALAFMARLAEQHGKPVEGIAPEALEALCAYEWPGNVRELENAVERAVVMAPQRTIALDDLPPSVRKQKAESVDVRIPGSTLAEIEREAILKSLEAVGGSTSLAAAMLGISPRKVQYRLNEYGLKSFADHRREVRKSDLGD
jgi:DNA-binding NtrC family response regulator